MTILGRRDAGILLLGDLVILLVSVWLALLIRYGVVPEQSVFLEHLVPFGILSVFWLIVFFIAGLYDKQTSVLRSKLPVTLFKTQVVNIFIAVLFFYLFSWGIEPKTTLAIYLVVSTSVLAFWRLYGYGVITRTQKQKAVIIGSGDEVRELVDELNKNKQYSLEVVSTIDLGRVGEIDFKEMIINEVYSNGASVVVVDFDNKDLLPMMPYLYNLMFAKVNFIDMHKLYEELFDRMPLSILNHNWFLENISLSPHVAYDAVKRFMDVTISFVLGVLSLIFYPFVYIAVKLEDGGPVFIFQERIGQNNTPIKIVKFRTMTFSGDDRGEENNANRVTSVGSFLRKSRIDELPQLWNVIRGDLSLVGPRPELPTLVSEYEKEIPYYSVRHIIKPGLSGWAQINDYDAPRRRVDVERTKKKLSYDLFYVKNHSFLLDLQIALKTIKTLVSRTGV